MRALKSLSYDNTYLKPPSKKKKKKDFLKVTEQINGSTPRAPFHPASHCDLYHQQTKIHK